MIQNRLLLFLALLCFAAGTEAQCACDTRHDNFCFYQPSTPGCGATQPFGVCDPNGDGSFSDADWDAGWFAYQAECAGRCHCFEGLDPQERPIDPLDVPCGTQVCGVDNERWECQAGIGYVNIGTCDGCRCTDGRDQNDNPIPPEITYCGYETCGNSGGYWRCSPGGNGGTWVRLGNCPNAPPTNPPPTNPPPTNPPPTNPPPTNPPPTNDPPPNSGPNAPFGTNSATWIEPVGNELTDLDIGAAKGLGYHLTILGLDDDWANPNDKVIPMIEAAHARGITPILRLCVAENSPCSYRNEPERVVTLIDGILNSGAVDRPFYVIAGPNEPPRERWMYDRSFNLPDGAFSDEQIRIIAEDIHKFSDHILDAFAGRRGGLVRFLSPVLDCHNANTPRLIQALHNDGFSFHRFDGVGFNSYNLHGYLATRYFNHCRSYLQNITRTMAYDYYQTETGMFEIRTGPEENNVPRGQGLDNLRSFFSVVRREPSLKASLLFNGNARSGDGDFDYNEISSGEWDYVLSDCGTNCPTTYSIELTVGLDGFDGGNQLTAPGSPEKMIGNVWGPDGTQEPHAANPVPNQELLGTSFGAYRPGQGEIMGQLLSDRYEDGRLYTFRSFAVGGANRTGALPYLLGYAAVDGDPSSFVLLEAALVDLDGHSTWVETEGVTWATAAGGSEIGRQIMIVFGDDSFGGRDEVWVDDVEALSSLVTPELPTSLVAAFTTDSDIGVAPLTVTFSDTSVAHGTEITSWAWDFDGDGTVDLFSTDPESTDGAFTFTEIGVYDPTLTVTDGLLEHTVRYPGRIWATTTPSLEAGFTASSTVGTAPFAVAFTDTSVAVGGRLLAWAWDFDGDGAVDSTEANPVHIFEQPGTYPITLTVSTDSGLSASWSLTVEVLEAAPGHDAELDESFDVAGSVASWSSTAVISHDSGTLRQSSGSPAELFSPFLVPAVRGDDLYLNFQVRTDGGALPGIELELYDESFSPFRRVSPFFDEGRDSHGLWGPERSVGFYVDTEYWIGSTPHVPAYLRVVFSTAAGSTWLDNVWLSIHQRPEARILTYRGGSFGEALILDGSASYDPDGDALSFHWQQVSGPSATLLGATQELALIPQEPEEPGTVRMALQAVDARGATSLVVEEDVLTIQVAGTDLECVVEEVSDWGDGFMLDPVTVTNHSPTPTAGWEVILTFPHPVSGIDLWNGNASLSGDGTVLTVTDEAWNGDIAPGDSVSFGLVGDYAGTFAAPGCQPVP